MMPYYLTILAGILSGLAYVPYIGEILRGKSRPVMMTWFVWATFDTLIAMGMYSEDQMNPQILVFASANWLVFLLSLRFGKSGWTKLDQYCLGISVAGLVGWVYFAMPTIAITAGLIAGISAAGPTVKSAWVDPSAESRWGWFLWTASSVLLLYATYGAWSYAGSAQIFGYGALQFIMVCILMMRS